MSTMDTPTHSTMNASQLGYFEKLPPELRLSIWESVISDYSTSIMRTSQAIYQEISDRLYNTIDIHLYPLYDDPWIRVSCRQLRLSWSLESEEDCFWDGLWEIPYHKIKLSIKLYAPDPYEKAQIILLWLKVRCLAAIFKQVQKSKSIEINFHPHNGNDWQQGLESIKCPRSPRPDHDLVFIPFCRLPNVRDMSVIPATWGLLQRSFHSVDALITDVDFFFDTELDTLPGRTAAMLRLKRFATWFSKPIGKIPYQQRTLTTIRRYPDAVAAYDPALEKLRLRYSCFDTIQLSAVGRDTPLTTGCDWQESLNEYPNGVPQLSEEWLKGERERVYTRLQLSYSLFSTVHPRKWTEFWHSVQTYLRRNWNVAILQFVRVSEARWCAACRKTGFREGCVKCSNLLDSYEDIEDVDSTDDDDSPEDDSSDDMTDDDDSSEDDSSDDMTEDYDSSEDSCIQLS